MSLDFGRYLNKIMRIWRQRPK